MTYGVPPIVKLAQRLQVDIENAVRGFHRFHKNASGAKLRDAIEEVVVIANMAWRDPARQLAMVEELDWKVEQLKLRMQLCSHIKAFKSLGQFEALMRSAAEVGRQVGGWKKWLEHPNGQNSGASSARPKRPKTLSTRATPSGVNA